MLYPLTFQPIFQERVWGGRNLESLFGKPLPAGKRIGESWEISDDGIEMMLGQHKELTDCHTASRVFPAQCSKHLQLAQHITLALSPQVPTPFKGQGVSRSDLQL